MNVTVPVYQRKRHGMYDWTTVGLGAFTRRRRGAQVPKLQQQLGDELRKAIEQAKVEELAVFDLKRGTHLRRVRIEITLDDGGKKRRVSGLVPLIVEPRPAGADRTLTIAYHPARQEEWFPVAEALTLEEQATTWFQKAWSELDVDTVDDLWSDGKDLLRVVALSATPRSLLDVVAGKRKGLWDDLLADPTEKGKPKRHGMKVLPVLGVDRTARRSDVDASGALPRSPYREQLQMLLGGRSRRSTLVVGRPGVGKSSLIETFIDDLLVAEDFESHRNLDRVTHVWEIAGKRLIAGMSYVGDWEQRVTELLEDVRRKKIVLYVPDLHAFGRIGQARDSSRSMADVLRGPVARGEVVLLGECTEEQLARLEQDAPAFASLFARVSVREASMEETFGILLATARTLEAERNVTFEPMALRAMLELGGALLAQRALPGSALDLLKQIEAETTARTTSAQVVAPGAVVKFLSERTGLPATLLDATKPLLRNEVESDLAARVIGQPEAVQVAADLVLRIRAGLVDPKRPYGVYLFTGPTGTGKTELAKAIAKALYGSEERLVRFDMGELGGPDAAARLIGDRWDPEGTLTRAVQEQPFSVVLFDEVEKAHPSVLNLFLQLFDDGRLTDAGGNVASFTHAVVIMTSNLGARTQPRVGFGEDPQAVMHDVARAVREFFPPELFNRIDRVVPFSPLSREVAVEVAQKELGKLLARRGLSSRHIFVQANRAVVERIAAEAFEQRDGARSLKRFLEDRIGTLIGELIAAAPNAMLRVLHLYAQSSGAPFRVDQEALVEAKPVELRSSLEPLLELPSDALGSHVAALLPELEAIEASPALERLALRIRQALAELREGRTEEADAIFRLDALRGLVASLRERIEALLVTSREIEHDLIERRRFSHEVVDTGVKYGWSRRRLRVLSHGDTAPDPRARTTRALLSLFAEAAFLRNALLHAEDPTRHAVALELVPLSPGPPHARLVHQLLDAYLGVLAPAGSHRRGDLDGWAVLHASGKRTSGTAASALLAEVSRALSTRDHVAQVVVRAVGMCLLDLFADETGTHVLHETHQAPALVRVRALAAPPSVTAASIVDEFARAREEAAHAVADEGRAPMRASALLPVVRTLTREPRGGPMPHAIEDFRVAYADTVYARTLGEALSTLFLLRLSREATEAR